VIKPVYVDDGIVLFHGDCKEVLLLLADNSVDSIVTDPPYELGFMGKSWDNKGIAYDVAMWKECLRVLKPGGHLAAFGGTRTYHRMACAIEDAGFEIRDSLHWLYGNGFPKGLNISKAIDKAAGAEREVLGKNPRAAQQSPKRDDTTFGSFAGTSESLTAPATDAAKQWAGWNVACKPAHEPIVLARKPLSEKTVAANVLKHGTGAINIDGCRVSTADHREASGVRSGKGSVYQGSVDGSLNVTVSTTHDLGRWPPNILLTHDSAGHSDSGGVSRFFPQFEWSPEYDFPYLYCAKAPAKERPRAEGAQAHPTVKPLALMRWLARLITPPGGVVLDLFCGTGTTLQAAGAEGFRSIGIDSWEDAVMQTRARLGIEVGHAGTGDADPSLQGCHATGVFCGSPGSGGVRQGQQGALRVRPDGS
jgi:site-specific DNA-methyltransferase (adenine-specific)